MGLDKVLNIVSTVLGVSKSKTSGNKSGNNKPDSSDIAVALAFAGINLLSPKAGRALSEARSFLDALDTTA